MLAKKPVHVYIFLFSVLLLLASFLLGLYGSYYTSPRFSVSKRFSLTPGDEVVLNIPEGASRRVFYEVSFKAARPVTLLLTFRGASGEPVGEVTIYASGEGVERGSKLLLGEPRSASLTAFGEKAWIDGRLEIRFSSTNYGVLSVIVVAQVATSLVGLGLLVLGAYAYLVYVTAEKVRERSGEKPWQEGASA